MASLFPPMPVFLDLVGRSVVLCAGDARAARFASECLEAGAGVVAIDPNPCAAMLGLAPRLKVIERRWRAADFRSAALVAVGLDERRPNQARASAKAAKAIFLMLDGSAQSDVALGETTARGPLTVGVAAVGLPAPLAAALRARIEAAAPPALGAFLDAAARLGGGGPETSDPAVRARFWSDTLAAALDAPQGDWDSWLSARLRAARG